MQAWLVLNTSWVYMLGVAIILLFSIGLICSRLGDIKLGPDHSVPEYSNLSWMAMLFSAGMGIGLLFYGVAEPIKHYSNPPLGTPLSSFSAEEAMKLTFFHWGLHAWAIYAVLAVTLAYFSYRKDLPLLPRSIFFPLLGEKIFGPIGDLIDSLSIIGTMFGVATSLGVGVTQVNAGLFYLFAIPESIGVQIILIAIITSFATISVVLGLDGGIKRLSNINMILAVCLLVFILVLGETSFLMKSFVQNTGAYFSDIVYKTFNLFVYEPREKWFGGWTLLYWGWWVSWSPFVGMFIARISKGRTIREFMTGVILIPSGFTFLWMTVFGNSAIKLSITSPELITAVNDNVPIALFKFLEFFPLSQVLAVLSILLIITFFVSSSDSGSLVIDTLASGGAEEPPVWQRIFWALLEGIVAMTLLYAGGLGALQTMTIVSAFPILFIILIGAFLFFKTLREDYLLFNSIQSHTTSIQYEKASSSWKDRLSALIEYPSKEKVQSFISTTVNEAVHELKTEFKKNNINAKIDFDQKKHHILISVPNETNEDFLYAVQPRSFDIPSHRTETKKTYFRAEVFLYQGGQEYDIYGYTKEQIIADALTQYEKHLHYLHLK